MWESNAKEYMGTSDGRFAPQGNCVWQFDGNEWVLYRVDSENGGVPSAPPSAQGKFKGQLRVTPCVVSIETQPVG